MAVALIGELFEWAVNAMLCGLILSASIHVYFMYYCVMEYFTKILMCKNETQGGISSSILSVFFTDKFALSQSDARISVAYNSCQWKTLTKRLMKCPPGLLRTRRAITIHKVFYIQCPSALNFTNACNMSLTFWETRTSRISSEPVGTYLSVESQKGISAV